MKRALLAVPVVLLGAGGYYLYRGSSQPAAVPTAVQHGPMPATITTGDGRVLPAPVTHVGSATAQVEPPTAPTAPTAPALPAATATTSAPSTAARVDVHGQDYLRTHDRAAATTPTLTVPMPGLQKMQAKLVTQASCRGPDAEKNYAALTGDARASFAEGCQRVGITLPR